MSKAEEINNQQDGRRQYFDNLDFTHVENITKENVNKGGNLNPKDIQSLCQGYSTNKFYYEMAKDGQRNAALDLAASTVLENGQEIKKQLLQNDQNAANAGAEQSNGGNSNSTENTTKDIPKISGGTMSEIIQKMNEMLNGKSDDKHQEAAENFSALFEVLELPTAVGKFDEAMKHLAESPVVVAAIKENLQGTKGAAIFESAIERNFSPEQKEAVAKVSKSDLNAQKEKDVQQHTQEAGATR